MEPGELVDAAVQLLKTFRPAVDTVDSHVRAALGAYDETVESDRLLLQQVFYGCQRFKKVLRVLMSALFFNYGSALNRADYHMLSVLSYLVLFRLDEMGWARVRPLLESQPLNRVHILINFLLDDKMTGKWLVEDWSALLDRPFILDKMLGGLKRAQPQVGHWLKATHARAFGNEGGAGAKAAVGAEGEEKEGKATASPASSKQQAAEAQKKPPTVPRSPRITKPRPRVLPEPIRLEQGVKARPVPKWLNKTTMASLQSAAEERRQRRAEAAERRKSQLRPPSLHETRNTIDGVRAEVQAERDAELRFEGEPAKPPPPLPQEGADVRLNAAAVLREDYLLRKRQEKEAAIVKRFEAELRDEAEFAQWRAAMQAADEEAKLAAVEQRRREMAASAALARGAMEQELRGKRRVASKMRERSKLTVELLEQQKAAQRKEKEQMQKEVREVRERMPREAEQRVVEENKARAAEVRAERAEAEAELARRKEEEAAAVADRARRLRAEVSVKPPRVEALFDPTVTAGHGFLGEISMLEAKERLAMEQARQEEEVERRRRSIMAARRQEQLVLEEKMRAISETRASAAAVARSARERRLAARSDAADLEASKRAESVVRLEEALRRKKEARDRERRELDEQSRKIAKRSMFLGAAKGVIEQRKHEQLRANREKSAVRAASRQREEHKAQLRSKALDEGERHRSRKADRAARASIRAAAGEALRVGQAEAEAVAAGDRIAKREAFFTATAREERLALQRAGDNVYATTVKEDAADAARARWGGEDREEAHDHVLQSRLARMTREQAEATGMAATLERRRKVKPALGSKMAATREESLRVTRALAGGIGASRAAKHEKGIAGSSRPRRGAGGKGEEYWRKDGASLGSTLGEELDATLQQEAKRSGPAMRDRRAVLTATEASTQSWMALKR